MLFESWFEQADLRVPLPEFQLSGLQNLKNGIDWNNFYSGNQKAGNLFGTINGVFP